MQIGITLVGIGTGVYSGAMLAAPLEGLLREISVLRPYAGVVSYTFVVALVTYLSLILGELIPKKMALNNPEKVAMSFAGFIKVIITAFKPLTVFLSVSTRFLLKALGLKPVTNLRSRKKKCAYCWSRAGCMAYLTSASRK
ncbi:MAG: CNNM domain-containing protein [Phascolarctobacterium faecium]